jgi:copper chaperone CopZ
VSVSVQQVPGVLAADINYASGVLTVQYDEASAPLA